MTAAVGVGAGWSHSCALLGSGAVACWGDDTMGQTGTGVSSNYAAATSIAGGADALVTGFFHSCAHLTTGAVVCWGSNSYNQLGEDLPDGAASSDTPVPFDAAAADSGPLVQVAASQIATCAIDSAHNVYCAGLNLYGELGASTAGKTLHTPAEVPELTGIGVSAFAVGPCHSCALAADTSVQCLGANQAGELGRGFADAGHFPLGPVIMADGGVVAGVLAVAATGEGSGAIAYSCAIVRPTACATSGSVVCWGTNGDGQLGDGTTVNRANPVRVIAPPN